MTLVTVESPTSSARSFIGQFRPRSIPSTQQARLLIKRMPRINCNNKKNINYCLKIKFKQ